MAEIKFNTLYDQLSPMDQDFYDQQFSKNYVPGQENMMLEMKPGYDQMKAVYEAQQQVPEKGFFDSLNFFSEAGAAEPQKYVLTNTDIALQMYTPEQKALIFGDPNYGGKTQTNNFPFISMADQAAASKNLMGQLKTAENFPAGTDILGMDESVYAVQDAPYGIGPDGKPYRTPRTIQDQNRVLGMSFTEPKQNLLEQLIQNSLAANLLKGVGSFAGDFFKGLVPYEYGTSQRYHQNLSPQGQAFANQLYRPGGSLQGYNQISAFGGGPSASLGKRADRIDKTLSNLDKNWSKLKGVNLKDGVDDFDRKRQRLEAKRDRFRSEQNTLNTAGWNQGAKAKTQGTIQQLNPNEMRNVAETGDAGGNTGAKIVCTMMNERYGFGSFRNKIWMKFHENHGPEYQKGYHTIFLPLVKIAKGEGKLNTAVRKVLEHMGRHVTADMFKIMKGKTRDTLGRIYRAIFEPTCRIIGKIKSALGRG